MESAAKRRPIVAASPKWRFSGPESSGKCMSKRELIEQITSLNRSARAEFLARFSEEELRDYLRQLRELSIEHRTEDLLAVHAAV